MSIAVPSLPTIGLDFDRSLGAVQFVVSAFLLGLGLAQPLQGPLCDRFGRRRMLLISFSLFVLASLGAATARSLPWLIVGRLGQGFGASAATVAARAVVRDLSSGREAARALAIIIAAMGIAPIVAPPLGGLLDEAFGWPSNFLAAAILGSTLLVWIAARLPETLRPDNQQSLQLGTTFKNFGELVRQPAFLGNALVFGFGNGAFFAFVAIAPQLFADALGTGPARFGLYWSGLSLAYLLGAAWTSRVTRSREPTRLFALGSFAALIGGGALVLSGLLLGTNTLGILLPMTLLTFSMGVTHPLSLAAAVDPFPRLAGTAAGLASALGMIVSAAFTSGVGAFYDGTVAPMAFGIFLAVIGLELSRRWANR